MARPLIEWESSQVDRVRGEISRAESERATAEARIQSQRNLAAKAKTAAEFEAKQEEIAELEANLPEVPRSPRVWAQDVTPERLGQLMADHGERMAIISDEGGIFDILAGRYSNGIPNLDLFLQSHAGAPVRVDRGSRPPVMMHNPTLTMALSPQPEVLRGLSSNRAFRGRGLLARILYLLPASKLGQRTGDTSPLADSISYEYTLRLRRLLDLNPADHNEKSVPHVIHLSSGALSEWREFFAVVESDMREGGRFAHITDWAGKLPGATARIAGLLHCATYAPSSQCPCETPVSVDMMRHALDLAAVLSAHALAAFDLMGADGTLEGARRIWRWIERERAESFSARDCLQALKGSFTRMRELDPGLEVLIERFYLFDEPRPEMPGPGRPSRRFRVSPVITRDWKKDEQLAQIDECFGQRLRCGEAG